ncbi:cold shock domain-containing protein [Pseudomonas sp. NPDC098740]|uniref:cold shock domain-containing protein n=1 Tax=Pseudomonas sp. NPDC098740 TaxID=3364486 RepID=UPI00383A63BF
MSVGKVKWFNNAKGFGFINTDAREGRDEDGHLIDFFAHYSAIEMDGYKTLKAGQDVNFEIIQGPKGLHAVKITSAAIEKEQTAPTTQQETVSS